MPKLTNQRVVDYPIEKIFSAVLEVESYPKILGFVREVRVLSHTAGQITARVFVGLPALTFSYDCHIAYESPKEIHVTLLSGPFKRLDTLWRFTSLSSEQTEIIYSLDSQFKNPLMELTAGTIFASQLNHSLSAFEDYLRKP